MDSGAHFHECDFQVHTPRDAGWDGAGAVTEKERSAYARDFVAACRQKDLNAVAITDHHDIAFFRYIRTAAVNETDNAGAPIPPSERLVVFPGMELTLGVPCQALLLFDADLPVEFLPLALPALGITPAPDCDAKHAPVKKLDIMSFEDLYAVLNKVETLKGRFIVFPHVGAGGYKTLIRKDFDKHYIAMPCVGGYVDGALPAAPKEAGMRTITDGRDKNWGNKALGLFQTSDSRSRDFAQLGTHVTWVKWSSPTAEALRQACLARHSRISQIEPSLPAIQITHAEVSNSRFLGPLALDFNPQYNALIGGRGTGKSSILEYIRWALCDQPPRVPSEVAGADLADFEKRRQGLVEGTLLPLDAVVDVSFLVRGEPHVVRRKASGELTLKIADEAFQVCTEQNIRELLPVRAYSQKQLSAVGARLEELRRFVHAPIQADLDSLEERIAALGADLRVAFDRVIRQRSLQAEIGAHSLERRSLTGQVEKLRSSLKGLSDDDQATITKQAGYDSEQRAVQALERDARSAREALESAAREFARLPSGIDAIAKGENGEVLKRAEESLSRWVGEVRKALSELEIVFAEPTAGKDLQAYFEGLAEWRARRDSHRLRYEDAKARAAAHEETIRQIRELEERLGEINEAADSKEQQLSRLGDPMGEFQLIRADWMKAHRDRGDLLEQQCGELTNLSRRLRATLRRAVDIAPLADKLKQIIKGTKIRGDKVDKLIEQVSGSADPPGTWAAILDELLELAWLRIEDEAVTQLPGLPRLDGAGFTPREKIAIGHQLQPLAWIDLLLVDLKDLPVFEYQVRQGDYLPFENASPGQQATALLSILLSQDGPPLLIDQPEDDLNMKIINEVVETLWKAKSKRQILFASHNANLVVNGDAELIICCDYRTRATESGGQIKLTGAIDIPKINDEIAEVMEGGQEAFTLRQKKYGF